MRCLIWGAGAIGGVIGAFLARAGHDVTLVDLVVEHVDAINHDGLRVTGPIAEFTAHMRAFTPPMLSGAWGTIVLATKAHHTGEAVRALAPHLAADGAVVSAQNGLNELVIADVVRTARTRGRSSTSVRTISNRASSITAAAARSSSVSSTGGSRRASVRCVRPGARSSRRPS